MEPQTSRHLVRVMAAIQEMTLYFALAVNCSGLESDDLKCVYENLLLTDRNV